MEDVQATLQAVALDAVASAEAVHVRVRAQAAAAAAAKRPSGHWKSLQDHVRGGRQQGKAIQFVSSMQVRPCELLVLNNTLCFAGFKRLDQAEPLHMGFQRPGETGHLVCCAER